MRAKTVYRKAYVFDFDDTLVKTSAKVDLYRNGAYIKSLTPKEYNFYEPDSNYTLDFSDFNNGELILNAKKYKMWPILKNVSNAIKRNQSTSEIYILTGRSVETKSYIYEYLKKNGIDIDFDNIYTIGDGKGEISIPKEKVKILKDLTKRYTEVLFFDDSIDNIKIANSVKGVKGRLVENKNKR